MDIAGLRLRKRKLEIDIRDKVSSLFDEFVGDVGIYPHRIDIYIGCSEILGQKYLTRYVEDVIVDIEI